jgi:two-component system cell cycle sensor histidine kinase/response regulator CckA
MTEKPTYEDLLQRVRRLEQVERELKATQAALSDALQRGNEHRQQDALDTGEGWHRRLYESVQAGVILQNADGTIQHANRIAAEIFGMASDTVAGRSAMDPVWQMVLENGTPVPGDEHPSMLTLRTGEPIRGAVRGVFADDPEKTRWLLINTEPIRDPLTDRVTDVLITFVDITERKKVQEALEQSEQRFRGLFEQAGGYCMILDPNTPDGIPVIVDANRAACLAHGYARDEFIGRPVADIDDEDGKRMCKQRTQEILTGRPFHVENIHVRKDGSTFPTSVNAQRIDIGNEPPLILTIEYDITEQRNTQELLRAERNRVQAYVDVTPHLILALDRAGRIEMLNTAGGNILKCAPEAVVGRDWFDAFLPARIRDEMRAVFTQLMLGNLEPHAYVEQPVRTAEGNERLIAWRNALLHDDQGQICGTLCSGEDITERKRAEEALRASEARYHTLFDASQDSVFLFPIEPDGTPLSFIDVNQVACRTYGYTREELLAMSPADLVAPEYHELMADLGSRLMEKRDFRAEWEDVAQDGHRIPVDVSATLLELGGQAMGMAVVRDMTERQQAQDALEERERYHRSLLHSMHEDIIVLDRDYRITDLNNGASTTTGLERAQMLGRHCFEVFHDNSVPCDQRGEQCGLQHVFSTGQPVNCHHRHVHADGSVHDIDILMSPMKDAHGNVTHVIESMRDVSDLFEAQRQLEASEEKHRVLFESSRDAIMILAPPSWDFTSGNAACLAMFGAKDEAEFTSYAPWKLSPAYQPDDRLSSEKAREMIEAAMREGSRVFEWTHNRIDGSEFPATVQLTRMELAGQVLLQATVRDISRERQMEEQLRHAQKMEAVGQLAAGVAHEFNNLLFGILGSAEIISSTKGSEFGEYLDRPLREIKNCGRRGAALTKQLLSFARKKAPGILQFDINQVIGELDGMIRRMITETITLKTDLAPDLPPIRADRGEIEQALLNLAKNARDAMPDGGTLTIRTATQQLDEARVASLSEAGPGTYVQLSVADTGCGMAPETAKRIFEPFFTTKPVGKGTGLGLSTVFADVSNVGGIIEVESHEGAGTAFRIYLPSAESATDTDTQDAERSAGPSPGGSETILVVDDDEVVLNSAAYMLEMRGYNVVRALGAPAALQAAASHDGRIDLLLTDVTMPELNGWQLARKLTAQRPDMKVIFMSGYARDVLDAGAAADAHIEFLEKPPEGDTLCRRVRDVLASASTSVPRNARVLVVDDEQVVRYAIRERLAAEGHEVVEANNGRRAMQCLDAGTFDIVITDILMPERDGLETLRHVHKTQTDTEVIVISGAGNDLFLENARGLGASRVLEKPLNLDELAAAVRELTSP